ALVIPNAGSPAVAAPASDASTAPPGAGVTQAAPATAPAGAAPPVSPAVASGATLLGDGLRVSDSVESTYSRVGLALERSGAATVLARDEASHSYDVQTTSQTTTKPGWFKEVITLGMAKGTSTAPARLKVVVSPDGAGSKVSVQGATDEASQKAAQALLATLTQRLS
ncbi:MAG: hypothetical protein ACREPX_13805, partial [Rhodanobacteraceae bacterium]